MLLSRDLPAAQEGEAAIVNPFWETIAKLFKAELSRTSSGIAKRSGFR
jgi:hypothetical protein